MRQKPKPQPGAGNCFLLSSARRREPLFIYKKLLVDFEPPFHLLPKYKALALAQATNKKRGGLAFSAIRPVLSGLLHLVITHYKQLHGC